MIDPGVWRTLFRIAALTVSASAFSCSGKERIPGQLVVSVETDVALPKAVDTVKLEVLHGGVVQFSNLFTVGPNADILIPGTLTIVAGEGGGGDPVTVRVIGSKGSKARTLRELVTTMPSARAAFLRMPIQWLCDDRAELDGDGQVRSTCDEGYTCAAGRCVEQSVPEPTLPDYAPEDVFGGGATPAAGKCFDTLGCMQSGALAVPDRDCTIARPVEASSINVALRVPDDGICADSGRPCFVPLDGNSEEGWRPAADRLTLPLAVCDRLSSGRVDAVVVSTSCPTKGPKTPPCGAWSSVTNAETPPVETPELVGPSQIGEATTEGAALCCALHADTELLYTCECDGTSEVDVVALDPESGARTIAATFGTQAPRSFVSTALSGDTLYFSDRGASGRSTLQAIDLVSGESSVLADLEADIFDTSPLLSDASHVYALASRVEDQGTDVQLLAVDRASGDTRAIAVGSKSGLQFDQDSESLYVIAHEDQGEGAEAIRESRILRIRKQDGATQAIATLSLQGADAPRGGFVGLLVDGDAVLALSRKPVDAKLDEVKLLVFDSQGRQTELLTQEGDAGRTKYLILGNSADAALLARLTLSSAAEDATVAGSNLLVVRHDGGLRTNYPFASDGPSNTALRAPAFDADGLYWVNSSGKVYRLPLSSLR